MDIEISSIKELDPNKLYHIALAPDVEHSVINQFANAVTALGLRALITRSQIKFELFSEMFKELPNESKRKMLEILRTETPEELGVEINPLEHEQTK